MIAMKADLTVGLGERAYPIYIQTGGLLGNIGAFLAEMQVAKRFCIVTDDTVAGLYADRLAAGFQEASLSFEVLQFPAGEQSKTLATVESLCRQLARHGFDRKDGIVALGGGVTGDIAGFVAAIYMRGIPFVQVPTTLLAQVDSSVGGKTGVDIPEGKNLVGSFYQPQAVFIDTDVLLTLPDSELANGLAEVVKYSIIRDKGFFSFLVEKRQQILKKEEETLASVIHTCCALKADVVAHDEKESGLRRILNFGHTIGHAVEAASEFRLGHGQAVAMGMVAACRLAAARGLCADDVARQLSELLAEFLLETAIPPDLDRQRMVALLQTDKKTVGGRPVFLLPTAIGSVSVVEDVTKAEVLSVLEKQAM